VAAALALNHPGMTQQRHVSPTPFKRPVVRTLHPCMGRDVRNNKEPVGIHPDRLFVHRR